VNFDLCDSFPEFPLLEFACLNFGGVLLILARWSFANHFIASQVKANTTQNQYLEPTRNQLLASPYPQGNILATDSRPRPVCATPNETMVSLRTLLNMVYLIFFLCPFSPGSTAVLAAPTTTLTPANIPSVPSTLPHAALPGKLGPQSQQYHANVLISTLLGVASVLNNCSFSVHSNIVHSP
jgi:hypothetical protein